MKKLLIALLLLLFAPALRAQLVLTPNPVTGAVSAPIDQNGWQNFKLTLAQNVTFGFVIAPPTPPPAQSTLRVIFTENATGGFTVTFASNILNACTVVTSANTTTTCQFTYDGTTGNWQGVGGSSSGGGITQVSSLPGTCTATSGPVQLTSVPGSGPIYTCQNFQYVLDAQNGGAILPTSFGVQATTQVESTGSNFTVTNASNIVTCTTCKFQTSTFRPAVVGDSLWATTWNGADGGYLTANAVIGVAATSPVTITSIDSDTQVHISANASGNSGTTNGNAGVLIWGPDDTLAWRLAKAAAYDGLNCQTIQFAGNSIIAEAQFLTATCRGVSGGSTASKYPGVTGFGVGQGATFSLPPWFTLVTSPYTAHICNGATDTLACFGLGEWSNVTWNTYGQAGNVTLAKSIMETFNDGSYQHLAFWGGYITSNLFVMNGGEHTLNDITADGGGTPVTATGNEHNMMGFFYGNGKSSNASLLLTGGATVGDFNGAGTVGNNSGLMVGVGAGFYTGYNVIQAVASGASSACWNASTGTIILHSVQCQNSGNTASSAIQLSGAGKAYADGSQLGGGATGKAWSLAATSFGVDGPGNTYNANPIGLAPTPSGTVSGSGSMAVGAGYNSPRMGSATITEGAGAVSSGTFILTFNQTFSETPGAANVPACTLSFTNGTGTWTAPAYLVTTASATAETFTITNGGALANGFTYIVNWNCTPR